MDVILRRYFLEKSVQRQPGLVRENTGLLDLVGQLTKSVFVLSDTAHGVQQGVQPAIGGGRLDRRGAGPGWSGCGFLHRHWMLGDPGYANVHRPQIYLLIASGSVPRTKPQAPMQTA